jgi:hypothetical protein
MMMMMSKRQRVGFKPLQCSTPLKTDLNTNQDCNAGHALLQSCTAQAGCLCFVNSILQLWQQLLPAQHGKAAHATFVRRN